MKAYESLESYNEFTIGWVKKLKLKQFLNCLLKLPWLFDRSVRDMFPSPFYCSILIKFCANQVFDTNQALCLLLWLKSRSAMGASRHPASMGNYLTILVTSVSPIYLVDEFHFLFLLFLPLRHSSERGDVL